MAICSMLLKYSVFGEGRVCNTCIIFERMRLLKIVTLPIREIFLLIQTCINLFMDSILLLMLSSVIPCKSKTLYSIPSATKTCTHSRSFSRQKRRSVSRIGPIQITFVLLIFILRPDFWWNQWRIFNAAFKLRSDALKNTEVSSAY